MNRKPRRAMKPAPGTFPALLFFLVAVAVSAMANAPQSVSFKDERDRAFAIREAVFQAEVHGRTEAGLNALRLLLDEERTPSRRAAIIEAVAAVKQPLPRPLATEKAHALISGSSPPQAVLRQAHGRALLFNGVWLEPGDWVGDGFIAEITLTGVVLQTRDGANRTIPWKWETHDAPDQSVCVLREARVSDLLPFIAKQEGLNTFSPSEIETAVTGNFPFTDWLSLLDRVCIAAGISWTRRGESVIFNPGDQVPINRRVIKGVDRKNQSLAGFLQSLAETLDLELVLDEAIGDRQIDIYFQDQPWDEVLDCLSIMNGFHWVLIRENNTPAKLLIQKE